MASTTNAKKLVRIVPSNVLHTLNNYEAVYFFLNLDECGLNDTARLS
jgi:hypothetical protein